MVRKLVFSSKFPVISLKVGKKRRRRKTITKRLAFQANTKKLITEEFQFFDSYKDYIMNYVAQMESERDDVNNSIKKYYNL